MKLRVGNACWHGHHVFHLCIARDAGFFDQEGLEAEVVHAKIYSKAISSSRPGGEPYDEIGTVLPDIIKFGIDIVSDVQLSTPFVERSMGNDELRIIGGWKNRFPYSLMGRSGIESLRDLRGKRIGDWTFGGDYTTWYRRELRKVGVNPDKDVNWVIGYQYGSAREAWKALLAGKTDAALVQNPWVPKLLEQGFNKVFDFIEYYKKNGYPQRVTVARKSFIDRNPELVKRYWKATIRAYQFLRIVPENYPFQRYVEAKMRMDNPDELERMRDLRGDTSKEGLALMESSFYPLDGQISVEAVAQLLQEYQEGETVPASVGPSDIQEVVRQELVQEAWAEVSQTDDVKRNLERLQPAIEKYGY